MKFSKIVFTALLAVLLLFPVFNVDAEEKMKPEPSDKCPVCGMFVAKYPDWLAVLELGDGSRSWFDGPKDMFKYYFDVDQYTPGKVLEITSGAVTEYYGLRLIEMQKAYYVIGSDVYGPMGKELIPFDSLTAAEEFMKDHDGKKILRFQDINAKTVGAL